MMKKAHGYSVILLALILLILSSVAAAEATEPADVSGGTVKIINHRGYNPQAPENTIAAFELSGEMGYSYVETDISFTKDLVPVLLHDATINRTAREEDGGTIRQQIRIGDLTYEEVLAYDFGIWKGEAFRGTRIPTFDEFLSICGEYNLHPYIELKENGPYGREQIDGLVEQVRACGMLDRVTWISFSSEYLEWVRDRDPNARLGYLVALWFSEGDFRNILEKIRNLRTGTNEVFLDASIYMLSLAPGGSDRYIAMCRDEGVPLEIWTLDSEEMMSELDPYITGVTTNSIRTR